ncbi:transposase [Micromonospora sp. NBC_00389]
MTSVPDRGPVDAVGELTGFRREFYDCMTARADALFDLTDAVLCADGPVRSLVELSLVGEHRRGHGALYDALTCGRLDIDRLRIALATVPLPRAANGRLVLAVDITCWLRPDANTSPQRILCHTYGRGKDQTIMIPGWPYSMVVALESGRSSWTAPLDAVRLAPGDDAATVTAGQLRDIVGRLIAAGQWRPGDLEILVVADAGGSEPGETSRSSPCAPPERPCRSSTAAAAGGDPTIVSPHLHRRIRTIERCCRRQRPVDTMFEECPFCSSRFRRFAVCFSLIVLPFFLTFALVVESLDMIEPPGAGR